MLWHQYFKKFFEKKTKVLRKITFLWFFKNWRVPSLKLSFSFVHCYEPKKTYRYFGTIFWFVLCTFSIFLHIFARFGSAECWFGENFTLCALRNRYPLVNPRLSWACWFFLYLLLVLKPYSILKMIFEPFEIDFDPLSIFKTLFKCHFLVQQKIILISSK